MAGVASRIKHTLQVSGLNARNLAAMSHVHHTTIYDIMREGKKVSPHVTTQLAIERALNTIDLLVLDNKLPLSANLSQEAKQSALTQLVEQLTNTE
jgi:plasmid maintenance system antidote protein VapI